MQKHRAKVLLVAFCLGVLFTVTAGAAYMPNNKDTRLPPGEIQISDPPLHGFKLLTETTNFMFFFKDERDIIAILDKRSGYVWKTGIDEPFPDDVYDACDLARTEEEKLDACVNVIHRLNTKYIGMANSLVTVEFYTDPNQTDFISSAASNNARSELREVAGDDSRYILEVEFSRPKIQLRVHILFTEKGIVYEIRHDEILGEDREKIAGILLTPFLGAEGGQYLKYDFERGDYDFNQPIRNEVIPGYVLVPDGPGALVRFKDYDTRLSVYTGKVYGNDNSLNTMYYSGQWGFVAYKQPVMPVFGIAHGNRQAAFVAYATEGDEQLEILMFPDEQRNMSYNLAYPYFVFNRVYYQIYNQAGAGYNKLLDKEQKPVFDIRMHYEFLAGDGSDDGKPADYVGMARAYRDYLLEAGQIRILEQDYAEIAARIDFVMADAQRNILGFQDVIVTTIDDVEEILLELKENGIANLNAGLIGYQKGGSTLGKPGEISFSRAIGSQKRFAEVISSLNEKGIDISLHQDFVTINEEQMRLRGNASRHATDWYTRTYLYDAESPIGTVYYARANKTAEWLVNHSRELEKIKPPSITVDGLTSILFSDYTDGLRSRKATIEILQEALAGVGDKFKINAVNPNQYAWPYVDRYLMAPVFSSQFLVETDTVPFLQLVLHGTMEMYAPYSNFSFYTDQDVLRMIDYNVYPAFVLTREPAHLLMATNSANFYSTEYELYKPLTDSIYTRVNKALQPVINSEWVDREVLQNGVIVNRYSDGNEIVINYTDAAVTYRGHKVAAASFEVIEQGGNSP